MQNSDNLEIMYPNDRNHKSNIVRQRDAVQRLDALVNPSKCILNPSFF